MSGNERADKILIYKTKKERKKEREFHSKLLMSIYE